MVWLATQSVNIQCYSLIHFQFLWVSDAKLVKVKSKMASRFAAIKQRNIKQAVPEITKKKFGVEILTGTSKSLSVWLEFINETLTGEKVFVGKCKFSLISRALLYLAYMFINKLQDCALAEPGGPWCLTFAPGRLENLRFFIQIISWAP